MLLAALLIAFQVGGPGCAMDMNNPNHIAASLGIEVLVLSRGRGVPEEAAAAFGRIKSMLERERNRGRVVAINEQVIGLEGERRLCASFVEQSRADKVFEELRSMGDAIDLLRVSRATCEEP